MFNFIKKRKKKEEYIYLDPELDIEAEFDRRKDSERKDRDFDEISRLQYVRTQCELMTESSNYINELKEEYQDAGAHLMDIQVIESQDVKFLGELKDTALKIVRLRSSRSRYRKEPPKISRNSYEIFERYNSEFPQALSNLQNDEKYCNAVKHDMRVLEAEKMSLREEIENAGMRRANIRNISIVSLLGIIGVFIVFFASGQLKGENGTVLYMIVLALVTVYVLLVFFMFRRCTYREKLAEKKLSRAITLLNKTKIKYVNSINSIEYRYDKFRVRNSYELGRNYEAYLEERHKEEKYRDSEKELDEASHRMAALLAELNLHDAGIWSTQLDALINPDEMKAVRNKINSDRQKLRDRIDYNMGRIESAKSLVMDMVRKHPESADKIMDIVDSYD